MAFDTPVLFVCGHRKCGTTMFLNLFDGHPDLSVYPHDATVMYAYHPRWLGEEYTDDDRRARLERIVCEFLSDTLRTPADAAGFDLTAFNERFKAGLSEIELRDITAVVHHQLDTFAQTAGSAGRAWNVIKETSIELMAGELMAAFPNAKFIQLLRDPRDNYGALKSGVESHYSRFGEDERMTLASIIHRARLGMIYANANTARFGADRYMVLRFEDLVSDSETALGSICDFLGIPADPTMLVPTVFGQPTRGNSFEKIDFSAISDRNIGRWRDRISEEEAAIIEFHFHGLMEGFGYAGAFDEASRLDAASDFYKWENDRYHYRDSFAKS
ncbi:MAG: sulfotransferase [Alphaproteobacteria bacterium]